MPYIDKERRSLLFHEETNTFNKHALNCAGDLNFAIIMFFLSNNFLELTPQERYDWIYNACRHLVRNQGSGYQAHNDVMGVLTCSMREFRRRFADMDHRYVLIKTLIEVVSDDWYDNEIAPYEDEKIEENGDIT